MAVIIITKEIDIAFDAYLDGVIDHDLTGNPMTRRTRGITTESIVTFAAGYQSAKHAMSKACPIKPITADTVTNKMVYAMINSIGRSQEHWHSIKAKEIIAAAVNAFIELQGDKDEPTS